MEAILNLSDEKVNQLIRTCSKIAGIERELPLLPSGARPQYITNLQPRLVAHVDELREVYDTLQEIFGPR